MERKTYLKNHTIYQVYVRNHTKEGTFLALIDDLPRIKALGVSVLYLLPIHPIGEKERKGLLGSPYAIKDYYTINPELGTLEDFKKLVNEAHKMGLKVMMDIVLHHTSPDSVLLKEHPEFFFYKNGKLGNKVGDWSDIIDLDYTKKDLWVYMKDMLLYWAKLGVDGFRADVAPLVPLAFWEYVRHQLDVFNPALLWLSESVEPSFLKFLRENNHIGHSDKELYNAFDMLYDYDVYPSLKEYLEHKATLTNYIDKVNFQQQNYPEGYLKIRTLENHDTPRIFDLCHRNVTLLRNLTAFSFFENGVGFIYAGQEFKAKHRPTLFDKDTIDLKLKDPKYYAFIVSLIKMKKKDIFSAANYFSLVEEKNVIKGILTSDTQKALGFFNLSTQSKIVYTYLEDGIYTNVIDNSKIIVKNHKIKVGEPLIFILPV